MFVGIAHAQGKSNLSGIWKLNVGKSDYGMIPPPISRIDTIQQVGDSFKDTVDGEVQSGKEHYVLICTVDSKETAVPADSPSSQLGQLNLLKIQASWESNSLVIVETGKMMGMDVVSRSAYSLSASGKTLTVVSHTTLPMGDIAITMAFDKQ
jgi:hypothetical protein